MRDPQAPRDREGPRDPEVREARARGAYVTYADTSEYLRGAAVLRASLREVGARAPFYLLVPEAPVVPEAVARAIAAVGADAVLAVSPDVPLTPGAGRAPGAASAAARYATCLVKLRVWDPELFAAWPVAERPRALCWLDADAIACENLDALLDDALARLPRGSIAAAPGCTCNALGNPRLPTAPDACPFNGAEAPYANSGVFLALPDAETYREVLGWDYDRPFPEQDAMSAGFGASDRIVPLAPRYNYLNHLPIAHPETAGPDAPPIALFHFGYNKPWAHGPLPGTERVAARHYERWRALDAAAHGAAPRPQGI